MNNETTALQAEINRLNTVISVLAEKNQELQKKIERLSPGSMDKDNFYIPGENSARIEKQESIPGENRTGIKTNENIPPQNSARTEIQENAPGENQGGTETQKTIPGENSAGIEKRFESHPHKLAGIELKNIAAKTDVKRLYSLLKKGEMLHIANDSVMRFAQTLKLLAEKDDPGYTDIRRVTGQTDSGISKMIAAMKRRKMLVRTQEQLYHLTGKAVEFLEAAGK